MKKRILSFFLALVMLFSCMSLNIFATEGEQTADGESTATAAGTVKEQSLVNHTDDKHIESIVKSLTLVSGKYQVNFGTGGVSNNESTRAQAVNGRIVIGARSDKNATKDQSYIQFNGVSNAGSRDILTKYNGHYATGKSFVLQLNVEITDAFVKDTAGHFGLIQPTTYLTNSGRDNKGNNQVGTWMSHLVRIGSNATKKQLEDKTYVVDKEGTQASLQILDNGNYVHLMNIDPDKSYNIAVFVDPTDVDEAKGIYGSFDVYVNGECVKERTTLLTAAENASMKALSDAKTPKALFLDGSYSDTYYTFAVGKDLTAYFFLPVGTVLDDKTDTDEDGIPDLYENVKGITAESAKSIKGYQCIGTVDGVEDFTLGFVRFAQTDGVIAAWGDNEYMYLDNMLAFFADEHFDPYFDHEFTAQYHAHDYTKDTTEVKYICEYCNSYKVVVEALDANADRVCDVCVADLEKGTGVLPTADIADYADSVIYVNDQGVSKNMGYNGGGMHVVTDADGNTYVKYGTAANGESVTLSKQTYGQTDNAGFSWPYQLTTVANYEKLKGKSYVYSCDFRVEEGLDNTVSVFNVMCYMKLSGTNALADMNFAFIKVEADGDLVYRDVIKNTESPVGVNIKDGKFHTIAFYHTPAGDEASPENTFDLYVDGKLVLENIQALGDAESASMNFTATLAPHNGSYNYAVETVTFNGAKDFIPAVFRTYQYSAGDVFDSDKFSVDNIKIYYTDEFFEHTHDYEMTHTHDTNAGINTVTYTCNCGHTETFKLEMTDRTGKELSTTEIEGAYYASDLNNISVNDWEYGRTTIGKLIVCTYRCSILPVKDAHGNTFFKYQGYDKNDPVVSANYKAQDSNYLQISVSETSSCENMDALAAQNSPIVGADYTVTVDFMHYANKSTTVLHQIASYTNKNYDGKDNKVVSIQSPLVVTEAGVLQYATSWNAQNKPVYTNTTTVLNPYKFYTISFTHSPSTNEYDVYVDGALVIDNAPAMSPSELANTKHPFTPGFIRTYSLSDLPITSGSDVSAYDNIKFYRTNVNQECAHSFVGDTCEWCGDKNANHGHCDICDGEAISAGAAVVSKSTSLGETIDMNVYMAISDALKAKADAKVTLECGARSAEFALADAAKDENGLYKFTIALTSIQMAEDVKVQVAGETSAVYTTSVKEYAEELIATSENEYAVTLAKALLNYGAASQNYFAGKNENADTLNAVLANAGLSAEDQIIPDVTAMPGFQRLMFSPYSSEGVTFTAATIMFSSKTHIKVYFTASEHAKVTVDGKNVTPIKDGEEYYITFTVDSPANMMYPTSVAISDGEEFAYCDFSAGLLVKVGVEANVSAELTALLKAYAYYGMCAQDYLASV